MSLKFYRFITYVDGNTGEIIENPKKTADDWRTIKIEKKTINKLTKIEIYETRIIEKFAKQTKLFE